MKTTADPRRGSSNSSPMDLFPPETWTPDPSETCSPATSQDTPNAIFSQASGDGQQPCNSRDGELTGLFGQAPAPVSRSQRREKAKDKKMTGTCGPSGPGSSASVDLTLSLASRLQTLFPTGGSTEYVQTWKQKATPLGRLYLEHTASAPRTRGSGFGSFPTPRANDFRQDTPNCTAVRGKLNHMVPRLFSPYPTPNVVDSKGGVRVGRGQDQLCHTVLRVFPWSSPTAVDGSRGSMPPRPHDTGTPLSQQVPGTTIAPWSASMKKLGRPQLNPFFSLWLMGYPAAWGFCGVLAMPSSRRSQRNLSKPTCL